MQFIVRQHLFAYEYANPPAYDRKFDIDLRLINSSNILRLTKEATGFQTSYLLEIMKPIDGVFTSTENYILNRDLRNMVLALNLALSRIAFITTKAEFAEANLQLQPIGSWSTVKQTENDNVVTLVEHLAIRDSVSIMVGTSEDVDESLVINLLKKIHSLNRFSLDTNSVVTNINLAKSLNEYENSFSTFDRLGMFKHLFNAVELSTNWDGKNRERDKLDKTIAQISAIQQKDAKEWREFYNRTKHVDRTPSDVTTTIQGMENLPQLLQPVRECARNLIINRLNSL
jgi:hypothetical protein